MSNTNTTNDKIEAVDILRKFAHLFFNKELQVEEPKGVLLIGDAIIASPGNITCILGFAKSGKSGELAGTLAQAITNADACVDRCAIDVVQNTEELLVLHIDTEQSQSNFYKSIRSIIKRAGLPDQPDFFKAILVRELSIKDRKVLLEAALEKYSVEFGGVFLIVIDGIADFVTSVNDEEECNQVVSFFEQLAIKYNCPILTTIHLNPSSLTKSRGHLGSQLERKAESILTINYNKDTRVSTLTGTFLRNAGAFPDREFSFDSEKGYHIYTGDAPTKEDIKRVQLSVEATLLFDSGKLKYTYTELVEQIKENSAVKDRSAKDRIALLTRLRLIEKEPLKNGKYYLCR